MADNIIKTERKNGVMMLELVIIIGFFAILSGFIVKIFVSANSERNNAQKISKALLVSKSSVEYLKSRASEDRDTVFEETGFSKVTENEYIKYYDADWTENSVKNAGGYSLRVTVETVGHDRGTMYLFTSVLVAEKDGTELYSYSDGVYKQEGKR